jgi:hypothetical protein
MLLKSSSDEHSLKGRSFSCAVTFPIFYRLQPLRVVFEAESFCRKLSNACLPHHNPSWTAPTSLDS